MQKNITLIRHGESLGQTARRRGISRKDPQLQDCFLSPKGISEASQIQYMLNHSPSEPIELVIVSPLTRALATTVLGLGHLKSEGYEQNPPFICHPDLAETGGSIPENMGRPINQVRRDLQRELQYYGDEGSVADVVESIDFSLVPPSWPSSSKEEIHSSAAGTFLQWLHARQERVIVVVCHHNVILSLLRYTITHVPNATPITCLMRPGDSESLYLPSEGNEMEDFQRKPNKKKKGKKR
jgi:broad specificity phosphatase PhoE